jgi:hypothetical protein
LSAPKVCGRAYSLLASNAPAARISAEIARRKIHAVVDTDGLPIHLALTPGEAHDYRLSQVR